MAQPYVHGYDAREQRRLHDQADTLAELLHHDTRYPAGSRVLEAGCGVGAQTLHLAQNSPGAQITALDRSADSLRQAAAQARQAGLHGVRFCLGDLFRLPFPDASFDHVFLCFVLEHLTDPPSALLHLLRALRPGGSLTVIEGDHGSCYYHPHTKAAAAAWQCLIDVQAAMGGDALIGRRLYPLIHAAGLRDLAVTPRAVYCDASRPAWQEGFVRRTIVPMVAGVAAEAQARGLVQPDQWQQGLDDLMATAEPEGVFLYTFFKGVGIKQ